MFVPTSLAESTVCLGLPAVSTICLCLPAVSIVCLCLQAVSTICLCLLYRPYQVSTGMLDLSPASL